VADQTEKGVVERAKEFVRNLNPFAVVSDAMKKPAEEKKAPAKSADGLLKGRSSHILNENVKTLRARGLSEAEATKKARDFLMSQ
jgi:hypothetical protein